MNSQARLPDPDAPDRRLNILQVVDAHNAASYFWAIRDRDCREARRLAYALAKSLGPDWRKRIFP